MIRVVEAFEEHVFNNKKECTVSILKEAFLLNVQQYLHHKLPRFYDHIAKAPPDVDFFDLTVQPTECTAVAENGKVKPKAKALKKKPSEKEFEATHLPDLDSLAFQIG